MTRYDEAIQFLCDPARVKFYGDKRRAATPCPSMYCGQRGAAPCVDRAGRPLPEFHPERAALMLPRNSEVWKQIVEKLARRYAASYDPMRVYGPRRYPR